MLEQDQVGGLNSNSEVEHPDRTIKCVDCGESFIWTSGEQAFFHDKGLKNEPKRCKPCKQAKNERRLFEHKCTSLSFNTKSFSVNEFYLSFKAATPGSSSLAGNSGVYQIVETI